MSIGTNIIEVKPIDFPDESTGSTGSVPYVGGRAASAQRTPEPIPKEAAASANSLPKSLLTSWTRIGRANMSVRMYADLVRIAVRPTGWRGPRSLALRSASLRNFLEFWLAIRDDAAEPELTLAPDGTLSAEWFKSERQRLDVRFLDHQVVFGLFANNTVLEGAEHRDTVAQILKAHHARPLTWSAR